MENTERNEALRKLWDSLTDEQKEKARACKTADELNELAGREKIELPDDMLEAVSGGGVFIPPSSGKKTVPHCGI